MVNNKQQRWPWPWCSTAVGTVVLLTMLRCTAPRDNHNDPLSSVYKNEPPRIEHAVLYDSIASFKPTSNDTHWLLSGTPVRVEVILSDDYQLYGVPTLQWALVNKEVDTIVHDSTTAIEFTPLWEDSFKLVLNATDNEGAKFSTTVIFISRAADNFPANTFALSLSADSGEAPLRVAFSISTPENSSAERFRYIWDFGDGFRHASILPSNEYTFYRAGIFPVAVQIRNNLGQQATLYDTVTVLRQRKASWPSWLYDITATPSVITIGDSALLKVIYDTTLNPAPAISWYIGSKEKGLVGNPIRYRFLEPGELTVVARIKQAQSGEFFESAFLYVRPKEAEHPKGSTGDKLP